MLEQTINSLPYTENNVLSVLSGGLDSSSATIMLVEKYGADRVSAVSFDYGQKQKIELTKASELCQKLGIKHSILDLSILGDIARGFSANISGTVIEMPTIADVIGDPTPQTYVPNRNMIMYSIAAAQAEVNGAEHIFCGLQSVDSYGYHDTTQIWVDKMNSVLSENRKLKIKISAPFVHLTKLDEISIIDQMGYFDLFKHTLTCYDPDEFGRSCGVCPSCAERIKAFATYGKPDPVEYQNELGWDELIRKYSNV